MSITHTITIRGQLLPIHIRRRASSRSMVVRYQPRQHAVSLTLPRYVSLRQGLRFVEEKCDWIERQIDTTLRPIRFQDGNIIPLYGQDHMLRHIGGRGLVRAEDWHILVPGEVEFMPRRVREWLQMQLRSEIIRLANEKAQQIGKTPGKISLRDTTSRWGSCSAEGNLSFSWRLIFAPYEVLEYLVSHEVAHLAEHNHGPDFWNLVAGLHPAYEAAQHWLKAHGVGLHAYG